jgi:hypothetical protein
MEKILVEAEPRITRVIPYVKDIPSVPLFTSASLACVRFQLAPWNGSN